MSKTRPQKRQVGSAFATGATGVPAPLLDGFTTSFEFEISRECTSTIWGWCKPLSGGFAFVLSPSGGEGNGGEGGVGAGGGNSEGAVDEARGNKGGSEGGGEGGEPGAASAHRTPLPAPPPLGRACEVSATVVQDGQTCPAVSGLVMNNMTTISCSGYAGVRHSVGVVFSLASGPVGNRYWTVAVPVVSSLSDWPRGSLSLFINGEVVNTTTVLGPARGVSQHGGLHGFTEGVHTAEVRYSAAMRMLYVHLDGHAFPSLWAELDPADLGLGPKPSLTAGFTATAPESGEALSIDLRKWELRRARTDGAASRLLEDGQVVGAAGAEATVHIDARDSCDLPRVTGGLAWQVAITEQATGKPVGVSATEDLGDGTYAVRFRGARAGVYELKAALTAAAWPADAAAAAPEEMEDEAAAVGRRHHGFSATVELGPEVGV